METKNYKLCDNFIAELKEKYPQENELPEKLIEKLNEWLHKKFVEKRLRTLTIRIVPNTYTYENGISTNDYNCFILRKYARETYMYLKRQNFNVAQTFTESELGLHEIIVKLWDYHISCDTILDIY